MIFYTVTKIFCNTKKIAFKLDATWNFAVEFRHVTSLVGSKQRSYHESPIVIGRQQRPESNIVSLNERAEDTYRRRTIGIDDPQMAA